MRISIIVAVSSNQVIGKDGRLLWHLPNDLKFFKNTTWGMPILMGRKTFASIGKPLPGRTNIVLSRNPQFESAGIQHALNWTDALTLAKNTDARELFVIGGGEIYQIALPQAHRIYLTRIKAEADGDTFFPEIKAPEWQMLSALDFEPDAKHPVPYSFQVWERTSS
jgi:dihydrofolate reductase